MMTDRKMTGRMPVFFMLLLLADRALAFVPNTPFGAATVAGRTLSPSLLSTKAMPDSPTENVVSSSTASASPSIATPRPTSSLPPRRSKTPKKKKKKKSNTSSSLPRNRPLSDDEIADHVSHLYMHGPGGVLRGKIREFGGSIATVDDRIEQNHLEEDVTSFMMQHNVGDVCDNDDHDHISGSTSSPTRMPCRQKEYYHKLDRHPTLVLNADYQPMSHLPLSIWHWQEAVKSVFTGKVHVVDVYPDVTIRAANLEIPLPSVIALTEYVPQQHQHKPAFTKRNVFLRDEYRCQYCNQRFQTRDLSLDHVHPRCLGGQLHWENAVTACSPCNGKKGSRGVSELRSIGMRLLRPPRTPTQYELASIAGRMVPRKVHPTWEPFLGMAVVVSSGGTTGSSTDTSTATSSAATRKQRSKAKTMGEQQQQRALRDEAI